MDKFTFGILGIVCLTALQVVAWLLHQNGQVHTLCIGGITALLGFVLGYGSRKLPTTTQESEGS